MAERIENPDNVGVREEERARTSQSEGLRAARESDPNKKREIIRNSGRSDVIREYVRSWTGNGKSRGSKRGRE